MSQTLLEYSMNALATSSGGASLPDSKLNFAPNRPRLASMDVSATSITDFDYTPATLPDAHPGQVGSGVLGAVLRGDLALGAARIWASPLTSNAYTPIAGALHFLPAGPQVHRLALSSVGEPNASPEDRVEGPETLSGFRFTAGDVYARHQAVRGGVPGNVLWADLAFDVVGTGASSPTSTAFKPVSGPLQAMLAEPPVLSHALGNARNLLELPDDWDGEGSEKLSSSTVEAAVGFLLSVFREYRDKESFPVPDFLPATGRSVDVHWYSAPFELLVNIGDGGLTGSFFGDRSGVGAISGSHIPNPAEIATWIAAVAPGRRDSGVASQSIDQMFDWGEFGVPSELADTTDCVGPGNWKASHVHPHRLFRHVAV